jgi:penicillin-binding protein-related factor A (putative recombinase)
MVSRSAVRVSAAYRGADFEDELKTTHEEYQRRGLAVITKHEVRKVRRRDGTVIYAQKSVSDFTGALAGGRFVAFDAKSLRRPARTWKPDARQLHQLAYLRLVQSIGGLAFYLVRNGLDEARLVVPEAVTEAEPVDLAACPLITRTFSSTPWDWLPVALGLQPVKA